MIDKGRPPIGYTDNRGMVVLRELEGMDPEKRAFRQTQGRAAKAFVSALHDAASTSDEAEVAVLLAMTSHEEAAMLLRAGLLQKIIMREEADAPIDGFVFGEGIRVGVHWTTDEYSGNIHLGIDGGQMDGDSTMSFNSLVTANNDFGFTHDELDFLYALADTKEYPNG